MKSTIKTKLSVGDEVVIIAGKEKDSRGKIISIHRSENKAIVEGLNKVKKHIKKSQEHPNGDVLVKEAAIHLSNLMFWDVKNNKASRLGLTIKDGKKFRVVKTSGEELELKRES